MEPPDDHGDDEAPTKEEPPAPTEEPAVVAFSEADFEAMLGSYNDLVLHVAVDDDGDDDDGDGGVPVAHVGMYELPAP